MKLAHLRMRREDLSGVASFSVIAEERSFTNEHDGSSGDVSIKTRISAVGPVALPELNALYRRHTG